MIHGGMGLMSDLPLERIWRDARIERIWDGTSEVQRHIIFARPAAQPLWAGDLAAPYTASASRFNIKRRAQGGARNVIGRRPTDCRP